MARSGYIDKTNELCSRIMADKHIVREVNFAMNDILVFLDESGNVEHSSGHPHFFFAGISVMAADYLFVREDWLKIRRDLFSLGPKSHFHSNRHIRRIYCDRAVSKISQLEEFLSNSRFARPFSWKPEGM